MEKVRDEDRPTCTCGKKMELIGYTGYYDEFKYWACYKCDLDDELENMKADIEEKGAYA